MFFVQYKFGHFEPNNTTLCTHFSIYHSCASDTCRWHKKRRSVKSLRRKLPWCTICCLKSAFHTCTPGMLRAAYLIIDVNHFCVGTAGITEVFAADTLYPAEITRSRTGEGASDIHRIRAALNWRPDSVIGAIGRGRIHGIAVPAGKEVYDGRGRSLWAVLRNGFETAPVCTVQRFPEPLPLSTNVTHYPIHFLNVAMSLSKLGCLVISN